MKVLRFKILCLLFLLIFPGGLSSEVSPKILLINSDSAVEKYAVAQAEFKNSLSYPIKEINLGARKWKPQEIENLLYDEYPDLVYCIGTNAYLAANRFVGEKNIIFSSIINWRRLPLTQNRYGVSNELHTEMQITLFRYIFNNIDRIGVLYSEEYNTQWVNQAKNQAEDMGVEIIGIAVQAREEVVSSLKKLITDVDALWLISDPVILSDKNILTQMFQLCDAQKVPVFSYHDAFAKQGAVLIVSVDNSTIGRQAAGIAVEVLAGEKMDERVKFPAGSEIIMNLNKVKEYGLEYNKDALASVNQLIE